MMRKNNNRGGNNNKHRGGQQRRYNNSGGGNGNRGQNDGQNLQRQKHHATQQLGKYSDLARNAQNNGDRVDVEYYLQHVDHYTRVLSDIAAIEAERFAHQRESQIIPGGPNDPNAQQSENNAAHQGNAEDANGNNSGNEGAQDESGNEAGVQQQDGYQPRRQRQPRRPYGGQSPADSASDNGAKEANANGEDIPLPGNILPPI